jgi:sec-independent protein translocase protein TatA
MLSIWKILLVLAIILIFFGAGKLPKVMEDLGRGIRSFKKGLGEETKKPLRKKKSSKKP